MKYKKYWFMGIALFILPYIMVLIFADNYTVIETDKERELFKMQEKLTQSTNYYVARELDCGMQFIPMEEYLIGLTAANIPLNHEDETIKAQIVALRTLILFHSDEKGNNKINKTEYIFARESELELAYYTDAKLRILWDTLYTENYYRLCSLVLSVKGIYMTYNDEPIEAPFFYLSAGMTRNVYEIMEREYPYLQVVECPHDIFNDDFVKTIHIKEKNFKEDLIEAYPEYTAEIRNVDFLKSNVEIEKKDESGYVLWVKVNGIYIPGEAFRVALNLPSSSFSMEIFEDSVAFVCNGNGLGIGMSQNEANEMAKEMSDFKEILSYFYKNCQLKKIE